jgi:hypothetical protein
MCCQILTFKLRLGFYLEQQGIDMTVFSFCRDSSLDFRLHRNLKSYFLKYISSSISYYLYPILHWSSFFSKFLCIYLTNHHAIPIYQHPLPRQHTITSLVFKYLASSLLFIYSTKVDIIFYNICKHLRVCECILFWVPQCLYVFKTAGLNVLHPVLFTHLT